MCIDKNCLLEAVFSLKNIIMNTDKNRYYNTYLLSNRPFFQGSCLNTHFNCEIRNECLNLKKGFVLKKSLVKAFRSTDEE